MRLLKCICGETPKHYPYDPFVADPYELSIIYCSKCDLSILEYADPNRAIQSWNAIIRKKIKEST